ncbi:MULTISPECIES: hypothetical protein [unclassified Rhizobium]|uniref:hypothetical protein n=1 Tax=unclassified Rhizobium TaxID=2613769 RepID=UPI0029880137|nr:MULTISPECIES: hypothetical protein [unclassified Rhizobium]
MRVKVYEKARGAVRRQLEAMNPRPSDDLVQRQLDKLEAAISAVEGEHAEALPAEEPLAEDLLVEEPIEAAAPVHEPEPEPEPEPAPQETTPEPPVEEPVAEEPVAEEPAVAQPADEPGFVHEAHEPITAESDYYRDEAEPAPPSVEPEVDPEHAWSPQQVEAEPSPVSASSDESVHPDAADEPVLDDNPPYIGLEPVDDPAYDHTAFVEHAQPPAPGDESAWQPEHMDGAVPAPVEASLGMPATSPEWEWSDAEIPPEPKDGLQVETDLGEPTQAATPDVSAELSPEWTWPEDARSPAPEAEPTHDQKKPADSAWGDLEDLIGYQPKADEAAEPAPQPADEGVAATDPAPAAVRSGQRSFRAEPRKRRISAGRIAAVVAALAVIGGAGAAYWLNKDAVDGMVADLTAPAAPAPGAATPAGDNADNAATGENGQAATPETEVASADAGNTKFTQRLLPDGTEADDGPAPVVGQAANEEGKSVAEQSTEVASTDPVSAPSAGGTSDGAATPGTSPGEVAQETGGAAGTTPPAAGTPATAPGATAEQAPIGVTQKMFIYEERLGQSAPTAIDGTVVWSQDEDSPGGDAKAEPVIRAQLNAPSNGLTAQVTIRRNADRSLPASHLVEIVFALPPTFEGGNIDSVQRVAMKRTEQDRGDPLIAVPAKITEDFHMIALNDFPDAITRNTELLKTRDWIDIPITYRNGRRALITLEKGASGAEVFNNVMNAWAALGPAADSQ